MYIQWAEGLKLGIPNVDADHKILVDLLNHFFATAQSGGTVEALGAVLNDLVDESRAHFRREETLLDRHNYPDLVAHAAEHQRLLLQMAHFQVPYQEGTATREITVDTAEFLRHWLLDHMGEEDRAYKPYVMKLS